MPNGEFRYMLLDKVGCNSGLEDEPPGCASIVLVWESRTDEWTSCCASYSRCEVWTESPGMRSGLELFGSLPMPTRRWNRMGR